MKTGQRIVLAGGSGFLGTALAGELTRHGYEPVVLTRSSKSSPGQARQVFWDGKTPGKWVSELDGALAVVNLAGKSVNCRHTPENLREIDQSRVDSVNAVAAAIERCVQPPRVWVQAGSLAIYGDTGDRWCDESTPPGSDDDAVQTCLLWEGAFNSARVPETRRVLVRIGFVLDKDRGALMVLGKLTRWFLGGTVGSGGQYISWIHIKDLNRMFLQAIEHGNVVGVHNAASPNPVTNAEFMRELRRALHRPWCPPAPAWAVKIGSWLMRTEPSLALTGRRCVPRRFLKEGFSFEFTDLRKALADSYSRVRSSR